MLGGLGLGRDKESVSTPGALRSYPIAPAVYSHDKELVIRAQYHMTGPKSNVRSGLERWCTPHYIHSVYHFLCINCRRVFLTQVAARSFP